MASESLSNKSLLLALPAHSEAQDEAQASTNDWVLVPETQLNTSGHNSAGYVVTNSGAQSIEARIMGRFKNKAGGFSGWVAAPGASASNDTITAGATVFLTPSSVPFDEVAVQIKSKASGQHGAASIHGTSKRL